jgi:hypothetical protein
MVATTGRGALSQLAAELSALRTSGVAPSGATNNGIASRVVTTGADAATTSGKPDAP